MSPAEPFEGTPLATNGLPDEAERERRRKAAEHDIGELLRIEVRVTEAEGQGIPARWDSAGELLSKRVGKQLPKGLLDQFCAAANVSRREAQRRMQFRERCSTMEEVRHVGRTFGSWYEIVNGFLPGDAHVSQNSGENEWYTPVEYIEAAKAVMGGIDLDPASTPEANKVVGASTFYTAKQDGLAQEWAGRVWMNPPYAAALVGRFCAKLTASEDVTEAITLTNNATETTWFQGLAAAGMALSFPNKRVKFWHPERESAPLQGQALVYIGPNAKVFRRQFRDFGFTAAL